MLVKNKHLILLHGATGSSKQFDILRQYLSENLIVHAISFEGHGGAPGSEEFSISRFARQVVSYIDREIITSSQTIPVINLFGYSMGGFVAMYLVRHFPGKVQKLITLATKFRWTPEIAEREIARMNPEQILLKVPAYAKMLELEHGPENWKTMLKNTSALIVGLGADNQLEDGDYAAIDTSCLLLVGDRDKLVGVNETLGIYNLLHDAQLGVLPGTGHPIDMVEPQLLSSLINRFIELPDSDRNA